jgi:hypothetical protein
MEGADVATSNAKPATAINRIILLAPSVGNDLFISRSRMALNPQVFYTDVDRLYQRAPKH